MTNDKYFNIARQQEALNKLNEKWKEKNRLCEICGSSSWTIAEDLVTPMSISARNTVGGSAYPQIMAICTSCGNTKYINAVILGVETPEDRSAEKINDR